MGRFKVLLAKTAGTGDNYYDPRRRRMMWILAVPWLFGAAGTLLNGYWDVAIALCLPGLIAIRMGMLKVIAFSDVLVVMSFFRTRRIGWGDISHFELKRFGLREIAVPSVVTRDSRRLALHGLDSPFSGAGARSPAWEPTLRRLSERLNDHRYGGHQGIEDGGPT